MIFDSSAVVAILQNEPESDWLKEIAVLPWPNRRICSATLLEVGIVIDGKANQALKDDLERFVELLHIEVVPVTPDLVSLAREAYIRFGKGSGHRAHLNFGDTISYAVSKHLKEPLLFIGDDFVHTDIIPATSPEVIQ